MHFDDRLATVLRHRAESERAARTQFRQLLDLLGGPERARDEALLATAWIRLGALSETIPAADRAAMLGEPGLRLRNPKLLAHLVEHESEVAAAALAIARLDDEEWCDLIPRLPVRARGFLRLRRDLSERVENVLERLGVYDRGLPSPSSASAEGEPFAPHPPANDVALRDDDGSISGLVRRIAAFQKARSGEQSSADGEPGGADAPRLPLGEGADEARRKLVASFSFTTDADGAIDWADDGVVPMVHGLRLGDAEGATGLAQRIARRQPLRQARIGIGGAPAIAGEWVVEAAPLFAPGDGRFTGYAGRCMRLAGGTETPGDLEADRLRQVLHELRTPVNAIQGFAEVIQQQLFGPVPHQYRALAAGIAGDAARLLSGFEQLDRLARLESGDNSDEAGNCDLVAAIGELATRLEAAWSGSGPGFTFTSDQADFCVPLAKEDLETLVWRLLSALGHAGQPDESLAITCRERGELVELEVALPRSLIILTDLFDTAPARDDAAPTPEPFGSGFALRLARAEARSAGGDLVRRDDKLVLRLPRAASLDGSGQDDRASA